MNKKVLILCTGNSCRSIIAEALINSNIEGVDAFSSGVKPSGKVNEFAKRVLQEHNKWRETYHSKELVELDGIDFDLVVSVCDHAKETCPTFPSSVAKMHVVFEDPDGKEFKMFEKTYHDIKSILLPKIKEKLTMKKDVFKTDTGVKIAFTGVVQKQQIVKMVQNCSTGACECMSDETKKKITDMQVTGDDGDVSLELSGNVAKEEIEEALKKSKVINS
jgi:arsenate reductase